jgi:hypothetical protein
MFGQESVDPPAHQVENSEVTAAANTKILAVTVGTKKKKPRGRLTRRKQTASLSIPVVTSSAAAATLPGSSAVASTLPVASAALPLVSTASAAAAVHSSSTADAAAAVVLASEQRGSKSRQRKDASGLDKRQNIHATCWVRKN